MRGQRALDSGKAARALPRSDDFDLSDQRSGRRQPLEPRGARKIVAARKHRRRRRHQPGPQSDDRSLGQPRLVLLQRHVDPHLSRNPRFGIAICEHEAQAVPGRLIDPLENPRLDSLDLRIRGRLRPDGRRAQPYHGDTRGKHDGERNCRQPKVRPAVPIPPQRLRRDRDKRRYPDGGRPLPRFRQEEPGRNPAGEGDREPGPAIEARRGEKRLRPIRRTGQTRRAAPIALRCSIGLVGPAPQRHIGHPRRHAGHRKGSRRIWQAIADRL